MASSNTLSPPPPLPVATADRLLHSAGELLDESGLPGVTMRAVGQRAGLSAMAAYHHFADRDAVLAALADAAFEDLGRKFTDRAVDGPVDERLHGILDDLLDLAFARPNLYALAFTERRTGARDLTTQSSASPTLTVVMAVLGDGQAAGVYRVDDAAEIALTFAGLVQGLWLAWHAGRIALPEAEFRGLVHRCSERVLDGLRN